MKTTTLIGLAFVGLVVLKLAIIGAVIGVIWHFVAKYW